MDAFTYSKNVFPSIKVLNMGFDFSFTMSEDCLLLTQVNVMAKQNICESVL